MTGSSAGKRAVYEPKGLDKCKQIICSPTRAALIVTAVLAVIFLVALIAALARPAAQCSSEEAAATRAAATTPPPKTTDKTFPWNNIRLPTTVVPLAYDLFMHPNLTTFTFVGTVVITLDVRKDTNFFLFHMKKLYISSYDLYKSGSKIGVYANKLAIVKWLDNEANEQVYVESEEPLVAGEHYVLELSFNGSISDGLAGFYRSAYETQDKEKR